MRSDEELVAEWHAARGKAANKVTVLDMPPILAGLRSVEYDRLHPKPLLKCPICNVVTRGPHNGLYPKQLGPAK